MIEDVFLQDFLVFVTLHLALQLINDGQALTHDLVITRRLYGVHVRKPLQEALNVLGIYLIELIQSMVQLQPLER